MGSLEFGRFRVLLRQRLRLADGAPIELGTRAFELVMALLKANGGLVSKEQLLARVWSGIAVGEDKLKMQLLHVTPGAGEDRDYVRTEFGGGYRFIAAVRAIASRGSHQWRICTRVQYHKCYR
jgi:DNA-binding winged helix-turn-helix (wHTH) protein